jgi:hypothetical protein
MTTRSRYSIARITALLYGAAVVALMSLSFWPESNGGGGLVAVLLSLPWGLGVLLALDTIDQSLLSILGPPLIAICGIINAFLLHNALRGRDD